jgi:hypothetical protein
MRTPFREAGRTQRSDQDLSYANNLRVVLDSEGRVNLDADTTTCLLQSGIEAVRLLWNAEQRTMVLRPVKFTAEFSHPIVRDSKSQQASFRAQRFFRRIGWRTEQALMLPLKWKDRERCLEIALPTEGPSAKVNSH